MVHRNVVLAQLDEMATRDALMSIVLNTFFSGDRSDRTWWLIPVSKWVITPVINGISRVNPLITGVITHLLSGMSHQVVTVSSGVR